MFSDGYQIIQNNNFGNFNNKDNVKKVVNLFNRQLDTKIHTQEILKQNIFFIFDPTIFLESLTELYEIKEINELVKNYLGDLLT